MHINHHLSSLHLLTEEFVVSSYLYFLSLIVWMSNLYIIDSFLLVVIAADPFLTRFAFYQAN